MPLVALATAPLPTTVGRLRNRHETSIAADPINQLIDCVIAILDAECWRCCLQHCASAARGAARLAYPCLQVLNDGLASAYVDPHFVGRRGHAVERDK